ncbi:CotH kinase family protein [Saccharophagus degradans]|uniref:CotH kinase family protein n=1 Tax=Saccharophagus degradans TaxID=86304 RepID=UPI002477DD59|nr:CotH kinase family protein [Saccharophagus degradans]WGO98689.1 CotH kinase family protein [Saccharophagus degradans]
MVANTVSPLLLKAVRGIILLAGSAAIIACGGGGGGSDGGGSSNSSSSSSSNSSSTSSGGACTDCIRINEVVASNSTYDDEDGDSPDWLELYNTSASAVNLSGWTLSDDDDEPAMWTFPNQTIAAGGYLRIWASDKNSTTVGTYRTLVNSSDTFRYSTTEPSASWTSTSFNDASWQSGAGGLGYGDNDDTTVVPTGTQTLYVRKTFSLTSTANIQNMWLDIDYDDAFVAYLNGTEIARGNILGTNPPHNAATVAEREAQMYQSGLPERHALTDFADLLIEGDNVLSIQVHNISNTSSDLTVIPFLTALYNSTTNDGVTPPAILGFENYGLHTNFKISSGGETLYLYNSNGVEVDAFDVPALITDISVGVSNSSGNIVYYQDTTPGAPNASTEYQGFVSSELVFSNNGGTSAATSVSISGAANGEQIRYTTNATIPTSSSSAYSSAIAISGNTVVRARAFLSGYIPSRTFSRTYLPEADHDIAVVTLVTEPSNFFDYTTGIYESGPNASNELPYFGANFWQDWERDIHFSFYEPNGELGLAMDAGVKIFGGWSRANSQRSLALYARGRYGESEIDYPLFPQREYQEFQSLVLRNSGNDWLNTMMRDAALTSLMDGSGLDIQAHRPTAVYLNGQYWGMYNLREKVSEHFLASRHNVEANTLDILEREGAVVDGSNVDYLALINFVENNSLSNTSNYNYVASEIDIENFITYYVAQIYFNNQDWPGNNIKYWRAPGGKWRWILYDTDFGFGIWNVYDYSADTLAFALSEFGPEWPNPPWSTLLFRKLMENDTFKSLFIRRFNDELNTRFEASHVTAHIDAMAAEIATEIPKQWQRWDGSDGANWQGNINNMKTFAQQRSANMIDYMQNNLAAGQLHPLTVTINNSARGKVQLNSALIESANWQGNYFENITLEATAIANDGYVFSHWEGASSATSTSITFSLNSATTLNAVFVPGS